MPIASRSAKTAIFNAPTSKNKPVDQLLLITVLLLLMFGLIMITSIGVPKSIQLSAPDMLYPNCQSPEVDCYLILKKHAMRLGVGLLIMVGLLKVHYRFWRKMSLVLFAGAVGLLIALFFFGSNYNTFATSWLNFSNLPFFQTIQPAELAKLALIFYFAAWLDKKQRDGDLSTFHGGFLAFCTVAGFIIIPIMLQPDFGATLVLTCIAVGMYFIAGANWRHLVLGTVVASMIVLVAVTQIDYLNNRFMSFFLPTAECAEDYCWQSEQAKIAVGSGGVWGRGLTQGIQKSYWLPQASDDFIFAASAEELGFLRILFVVGAYSVILYRGLQIANYAPDGFARMAAAGITIWITAQAFINIAVNVALFPVTGITLPFVSYGGSSLVTSLVGMAVLLNISQYTHKRASVTFGRRHSGTRVAAYRRPIGHARPA